MSTRIYGERVMSIVDAVRKIEEVAEKCRRAGGNPIIQIYGGRVKITCMGRRGAGHWFKYDEIPRDIMEKLVEKIAELRGKGLKSSQILEELKREYLPSTPTATVYRRPRIVPR